MAVVKDVIIQWPHAVGPMPDLRTSVANNITVKVCPVEGTTVVMALTEAEARHLASGYTLTYVAADRLGTVSVANQAGLLQARPQSTRSQNGWWRLVWRRLLGR